MGRIDTLLSKEAIDERIQTLAAEIERDFEGETLTVIIVLKGSFIFAADLVRAINVPLRCDFLGLRSYEGKESTGVVQITHDLTRNIEGEHVLIIEDIVDTGLTMEYLLDNLKTRKPASLKVASLLHKPARTKIEVPIDYLGFTIDDVFVIGYGLDFDQKFRNLPFIGVMTPDAD